MKVHLQLQSQYPGCCDRDSGYPCQLELVSERARIRACGRLMYGVAKNPRRLGWPKLATRTRPRRVAYEAAPADRRRAVGCVLDDSGLSRIPQPEVPNRYRVSWEGCGQTGLRVGRRSREQSRLRRFGKGPALAHLRRQSSLSWFDLQARQIADCNFVYGCSEVRRRTAFLLQETKHRDRSSRN